MQFDPLCRLILISWIIYVRGEKCDWYKIYRDLQAVIDEQSRIWGNFNGDLVLRWNSKYIKLVIYISTLVIVH